MAHRALKIKNLNISKAQFQEDLKKLVADREKLDKKILSVENKLITIDDSLSTEEKEMMSDIEIEESVPKMSVQDMSKWFKVFSFKNDQWSKFGDIFLEKQINGQMFMANEEDLLKIVGREDISISHLQALVKRFNADMRSKSDMANKEKEWFLPGKKVYVHLGSSDGVPPHWELATFIKKDIQKNNTHTLVTYVCKHADIKYAQWGYDSYETGYRGFRKFVAETKKFRREEIASPRIDSVIKDGAQVGVYNVSGSIYMRPGIVWRATTLGFIIKFGNESLEIPANKVRAYTLKEIDELMELEKKAEKKAKDDQKKAKDEQKKAMKKNLEGASKKIEEFLKNREEKRITKLLKNGND